MVPIRRHDHGEERLEAVAGRGGSAGVAGTAGERRANGEVRAASRLQRGAAAAVERGFDAGQLGELVRVLEALPC